jgi:hypothetical protein
MSYRDSLLDHFAGDLEYHPRRGALYLVLAAAGSCTFYLTPADSKLTTSPLVFVLGAITLLTKGLFLFRRSSEGIGLTEAEVGKLSSRKNLPSLPNLTAQIVQDFGAGPLLLWPLLRLNRESTADWNPLTEYKVLLAGVLLFGLGWILRRATTAPTIGE